MPKVYTEYNADISSRDCLCCSTTIRSNVEASTRTIDLAVGTVCGMHACMHYVRTLVWVAVYAVHLTDVDVTTPTYMMFSVKSRTCVKCQLVSSVN
jgi:hypothetical protein